MWQVHAKHSMQARRTHCRKLWRRIKHFKVRALLPAREQRQALPKQRWDVAIQNRYVQSIEVRQHVRVLESTAVYRGDSAVQLQRSEQGRMQTLPEVNLPPVGIPDWNMFRIAKHLHVQQVQGKRAGMFCWAPARGK